MTLREKTEDFYKEQIEEHYAPFIKKALAQLIATPLGKRPPDIKVVKDKTMDPVQFSEPIDTEAVKIRYHLIDLGFFEAYIFPDLAVIEIATKEIFRVFLKFSIQKELFSSHFTPIKKASLGDADVIDGFTNHLREIINKL